MSSNSNPARLAEAHVDLEAVANIIGGLMLSLGYFGRVVFERDKKAIDAQIAAVATQLCTGLTKASD